MKNNFLYFLLFISFFSNIFTQSDNYENMWLSFPACHMGRLQSPVRLNISESKYSNSFSIVYQYFDKITFKDTESANFHSQSKPSRKFEIINDGSGYINLQRNGVIKQYSFDHVEMFRGLHKVESSKSEFEVHLIFKKELGFSTNQNQYRRITDTNNYLAIVLRYNNSESKTATQTSSIPLASDGGLLEKLMGDEEINFNDFSIVIEAVKYSSGSAKRKQHIEKTFNYDPSRKFIYDLIYFDGTESFYDAWNNVLDDINNASYPVGYEKKSFEELNSNNNGIKIAKSYHNNDLIFYHIMGNFKYIGT